MTFIVIDAVEPKDKRLTKKKHRDFFMEETLICRKVVQWKREFAWFSRLSDTIFGWLQKNVGKEKKREIKFRLFFLKDVVKVEMIYRQAREEKLELN